jgi:hypothetical protein
MIEAFTAPDSSSSRPNRMIDVPIISSAVKPNEEKR